jgi:3-oxoacyl-[acyl-carrier-protein] synthase-3
MATTTPDLPVASTGVYVASQIGAVNAFAFDLQAACSGFLFECQPFAAYIESENTKNILIGADKMSSIIDYTDRATCNIWRWWWCCLFEPNFEGFNSG